MVNDDFEVPVASREEALREALLRRARLDGGAAAFVEYILADSFTGKPVRNADMHEEWHRAADDNKFTLILAPRDHAKCWASGQYVNMADGSRKLIETLAPGDRVVGLTGETTVLAVSDNGVRDVYRVTFRTGRRLDVTAEHPLLAMLTPYGVDVGWINASSVVAGTKTLCPEKWYADTSVNETLTTDQAKFLGYMIGDGSLRTAYFSKKQGALLDSFSAIALRLGFGVRRYRGSNDYLITGSRGFLRHVGLLGCNSYSKHVPEAIFQSNADVIASFLGAYYDCDGWVSRIRDDGSPQYGGLIRIDSMSERLLRDCQQLLMRFGIRACLRETNLKTQKGLRHMKRAHGSAPWFSYCLEIRAHDDIARFAKFIPLAHKEKRERLDGAVAYNAKHHKWTMYGPKYAGCFLDKVMSVEHIGQLPTISVTTKDHTLMVEGVISHNTEQMVISRTVWELGMNPNLRIKIICESDDKAKERLSAIKEHIESNPYVRRVFPDLVPAAKREWGKTLTVQRTSITKDASVEAKGVLAAATGGRSDLLIFDDIVSFRNAITNAALRPQVIEKLLNDWMNLLEPHGRIIYVATPWHIEDATAVLAKMDAFYQIRHAIDLNGRTNPPATIRYVEQDGVKHAVGSERRGILWPAKWSKQELMSRKSMIGSRSFARAFELVAIADDEVLFGQQLIQRTKRYDMQFGQEYSKLWPKVLGIDLASSLGKKASYTVFFSMVIDPNTGIRIPQQIIRGRMTFPDVIRTIINLQQVNNYAMIGVENNAFQQAVVTQVVAQAPAVPCMGFTTGTNKLDLNLGLPSIQVQFENGGWVIPAADEDQHPVDCQCSYCVWLEELGGFPVGQDSPDTVMAMWIAEQAARYSVGALPVQHRELAEALPRPSRWRRPSAVMSDDDNYGRDR